MSNRFSLRTLQFSRDEANSLQLSRRDVIHCGVNMLAGLSINRSVSGAYSPSMDWVNLLPHLGDDKDITHALTRLRASGHSHFYLPTGDYLIRRGYDISGLYLRGDGPETIVRARAESVRQPLPLMIATGTTRSLPPIADYDAERAILRFLMDPKIQTEEILHLYVPIDGSFSEFRESYRAGEFARGGSSSSEFVRLEGPLRGDYWAPSVNGLAVKPATCTLENLRLVTNTGPAIRLSYCYGATLRNVDVDAKAEHGVTLDRCFRFAVKDCHIRNVGTGGSSDYGLAIGNSQDGYVEGGQFYGRRHGISIGGGDFSNSLPNRFIKISNLHVSNDHMTGVNAADVHGNSAHVVWSNTRVKGGLTVGGRDIRVENCEMTANLHGIVVTAAEVSGGLFQISNSLLMSRSDPSIRFRGLIDFGGNSNAINSKTRTDVTIEVLNCMISVNYRSETGRIIELRNRGSKHRVNLRVHGLEVLDGEFGMVAHVKSHPRQAWNGFVRLRGIKGLQRGARLVTGVPSSSE